MTEKVLCPYCGGEMIVKNVVQVRDIYWAHAECGQCKSTGPLICSERGLVMDAENMGKFALFVAKTR